MIEVNINSLPPGWTWTALPSLIPPDGLFLDGDWVETKDQDPHGEVRLIQLADVGDGLYRNRSDRHLTHQKALELRCTFLEVGDVLIARMPDPLGRACMFPGDRKQSVTVVDVCIVRTGRIGPNNRWLMYAVNSPQFRTSIAAQQSGSTRKRISRGNLAKLEIPLPPLPEQRRIVAKIEELFSKLDAGVEALKKVKAELKRYRQSVLKHAFEGNLTAEYRRQKSVDDSTRREVGSQRSEATRIAAEPRVEYGSEDASALLARIREDCKKALGKKYKEPAPIDTSDLPALPEAWAWVTLSEIGAPEPNAIVDGPFGSNMKNSDYVEDGVPVISITNIDEGFQRHQIRFITQEKFETLRRSAVRPGDILVAKIGSSYGKTGYYPDWMPVGIIPANLLKVSVNEQLKKPYVFHYLKSGFFKTKIDTIMKSTAQPAFNVTMFRALPFPMAPLAEQEIVVSEIERRFSVADQIEKTVDESLRQAERLRQSILKRAFEGKLVPQDPTDSPASVLLEQIRLEKERRAAEKGRKSEGEKEKKKKNERNRKEPVV